MSGTNKNKNNNSSSSSSSPNHIDNAASLFISRGMESIVGNIIGDYACSWENCCGTLYAGSKGVYFLGTFFLFERKVVLYWEDIRLVQKLEQGIEVVSKDGAVQRFLGIQSPARVWSLLVSMHNEALLDRPAKQRSMRASMLGAVRRRNSDPWAAACVVDDLFNEDEDQEQEQDADSERKSLRGGPPERTDSVAALLEGEEAVAADTTSSSITPKSSNVDKVLATTGPLRLQPVACAYKGIPGKMYAGENAVCFKGQRFFWEKKSRTIPWEQVLRLEIVDTSSDEKEKKCDGLRFIGREDEVFEYTAMDNADQVWSSLLALHNEKLTALSATRRPSAPRRMNSDPMYSSHIRLDFADEEEDGGDSVRTINSSSSTQSKKPDQDAADWSAALKETANFSHTGVKAHTLKCSLDSFFELFVKDDADHSLARFMEERGDSELKTDTWVAQSHDILSRVVYYTHPVNVPLAPPEAAARKEQTYRRYGNHGLVLETKTYVQDVPMTDCFYVADRVVVEPHDGKSDEVSVLMEFEITFIKSTMFKSIISKTTKSEFDSFVKDLATYTSKAMGEAAPTIKAAETIPVHKPTAPPPARNALLEYAVPVLLLIIVIFQAWIVLELRGIKLSVQKLEASDLNGATNGVAE